MHSQTLGELAMVLVTAMKKIVDINTYNPPRIYSSHMQNSPNSSNTQQIHTHIQPIHP